MPIPPSKSEGDHRKESRDDSRNTAEPVILAVKNEIMCHCIAPIMRHACKACSRRSA